MLTASQVYTYTRRILDAYAAVMQPLSAELDMAPNAVDILLFLANNPGLDTARDICTYRRLKPGIVSFHVDNLVREGYLLRTRDPGDRRRCRLVCTDKAAPIIARSISSPAPPAFPCPGCCRYWGSPSSRCRVSCPIWCAWNWWSSGPARRTGDSG